MISYTNKSITIIYMMYMLTYMIMAKLLFLFNQPELTD
jgi:hypothetical protein